MEGDMRIFRSRAAQGAAGPTPGASTSWPARCLAYWRQAIAEAARRQPSVEERNRRLEAELEQANKQAVFWAMRDVALTGAHFPGSSLDAPVFVLGASGRFEDMSGSPGPGRDADGSVLKWLHASGLTVERHAESRRELIEREGDLNPLTGRFRAETRGGTRDEEER
jgi:hypothetical protein